MSYYLCAWSVDKWGDIRRRFYGQRSDYPMAWVPSDRRWKTREGAEKALRRIGDPAFWSVAEEGQPCQPPPAIRERLEADQTLFWRRRIKKLEERVHDLENARCDCRKGCR